MNYKIYAFVVFLMFNISGFGQNVLENSVLRAYLIKNQLSSKDQKKTESLENDEKEAMILMQVSDKNYEELGKIGQLIDGEKNKKKLEKLLKKSSKFETRAIKNRIESLKSYHQVFVQRYKIYKQDLRKFLTQANSKQIDSCAKLESLAHDAFEKADYDIERVYYTINPTDLFKIFTRAYQSEKLGLLFQEKMYAVYLDWNDTIINRLKGEILAFVNNEPMEEDQTPEIEISIKDSVNITTIVIYDTIKVQRPETEVIYKVQIAASKMKIDTEQLRKIYSSIQLINSEIDNGWYKYTIGKFTNYQDAQRFKINTGVADSFIVAYKAGKRTPINEFVDRTSFIQK